MDVCEEVELEDAEDKLLLLADEEQLGGNQAGCDSIKCRKNAQAASIVFTSFIRNNFYLTKPNVGCLYTSRLVHVKYTVPMPIQTSSLTLP